MNLIELNSVGCVIDENGVTYPMLVDGGYDEDGVHKGIPHKKGDVFKAAGWAAPAKWARGSIFSDDKFYSWTGPNYL